MKITPLLLNTTLIGWNNLGMHCMDDDFSVLSILPPLNTVNAQFIDATGRLVKSAAGITISFEAVADPDGSIAVSHDLGIWVPATIATDTPLLLKARDPLPIGSTQKSFMRLKATRCLGVVSPAGRNDWSKPPPPLPETHLGNDGKASPLTWFRACERPCPRPTARPHMQRSSGFCRVPCFLRMGKILRQGSSARFESM